MVLLRVVRSFGKALVEGLVVLVFVLFCAYVAVGLFGLLVGAWIGLVVSPLDLAGPDTPPVARLAVMLGPPLGLVLGVCGVSLASWLRERAARRALLAGAVRTTSGFRFVKRPGRDALEAVLIVEGAPLDAAAREYAAQVHVPRGDRESLRFGRFRAGPLSFELELQTALGGHQVLHFRPLPR